MLCSHDFVLSTDTFFSLRVQNYDFDTSKKKKSLLILIQNERYFFMYHETKKTKPVGKKKEPDGKFSPSEPVNTSPTMLLGCRHTMILGSRHTMLIDPQQPIHTNLLHRMSNPFQELNPTLLRRILSTVREVRDNRCVASQPSHNHSHRLDRHIHPHLTHPQLYRIMLPALVTFPWTSLTLLIQDIDVQCISRMQPVRLLTAASIRTNWS